jgi:2-oxoglutarate ferredoxin oxidoreductase subunit beta
MAPTTLLGQKTTSSPAGRDARTAGYPILMTEMLALLPGVAYAARASVADPGHIGKMKAMIRKACQAQIDGAGFSIVEVLSNCPVGWGMTAPDSMAHLSEVSEVYPLGVLVDRTEGAT